LLLITQFAGDPLVDAKWVNWKSKVSFEFAEVFNDDFDEIYESNSLLFSSLDKS
jgi:hypothetical protein